MSPALGNPGQAAPAPGRAPPTAPLRAPETELDGLSPPARGDGGDLRDDVVSAAAACGLVAPRPSGFPQPIGSTSAKTCPCPPVCLGRRNPRAMSWQRWGRRRADRQCVHQAARGRAGGRSKGCRRANPDWRRTAGGHRPARQLFASQGPRAGRRKTRLTAGRGCRGAERSLRARNARARRDARLT
jgi:hypothetical protein